MIITTHCYIGPLSYMVKQIVFLLHRKVFFLLLIPLAISCSLEIDLLPPIEEIPIPLKEEQVAGILIIPDIQNYTHKEERLQYQSRVGDDSHLEAKRSGRDTRDDGRGFAEPSHLLRGREEPTCRRSRRRD